MIKKILFFTIYLITFYSFSQEQYYNDVDLTLTGIELKDELATKIIATHTTVLEYTSSGPDVWDATKATDEYTTNTDEVVLFYGWEEGSDDDVTNDISRDKDLQDSGSGDEFVWNREHVFPKSLADPVLDTDVPGPATDSHHLRAADRTRNSTRNNRKYGSGSGNSDFSTDTYSGSSGTNTPAWYPGDEWKGDAARMIMYMYVRYGDVCLPSAVGVGSSEFTPDDMIDLFLQWNVEDPVSQIEMNRNTYHEDTSNYAAQGNRNPFIDNPYLATRIWGGDSAEDLWGIYTGSDTEAPTVPMNIVLSNITNTTIDVSWDASTDNESVAGYNVYVDGTLTKQVTTTSVTIENLASNTTYAFSVLAKDIINNQSALSTPVNGTTLADNEAPTAPTNLVASNATDSSFKITWDAATDNVAVTEYDVYLDGAFNTTTTDLTYTFSGLTADTSYSSYVIAKDAVGNESTQSETVTIDLVSGGTGAASELFFSEYVEPDGGNNKALEIVNLTGATVSLAGYSIKKQSNGAGDWIDEFDISTGSVTSIVPGDVFVIIHEGADDATLVQEADLTRESSDDTNYASPINFNGNDPIGLFKNGVLIDIIGDLDGGSGNAFALNTTLRRNSDVSSPNTTYDAQGEWTSYAANTFEDIGQFTTTLSTKDNELQDVFNLYPNPIDGETLFINTSEDLDIRIYSVLGELLKTQKVSTFNNEINIENLNSGIYIIKLSSGSKSTSQKIIKL